jgi:hypothetical protein
MGVGVEDGDPQGPDAETVQRSRDDIGMMRHCAPPLSEARTPSSLGSTALAIPRLSREIGNIYFGIGGAFSRGSFAEGYVHSLFGELMPCHT